MQRHPSLDDRFDPAVRIVDHDPAWRSLAERELRRIEDAVGDVAARVEHIGSTAVPGLAAKDEYVTALERRAVGWARRHR